jgi:hypothetical protein
MTTIFIPVQTTRRGPLELLVARVAIAMLRWSNRPVKPAPTHEQRMFRRRYELDRANAPYDFWRVR